MKESKNKLKPDFFQSGGYTPTQLASNTFTPTYAGNSLAESEKYGEGIVNLYNQNISEMTKLDIMNASRRVNAGDQGVSDQIGAELQKEFDAMAKAGDYENMSSRVNALARRYVNDPRRKAIEEQASIADQENKLSLEIAAKTGKKPLFGTDWTKHQAWVIDPETGKGSANIKQSGIESQLEYDQQRNAMWESVKPDQFFTPAEAIAGLKKLPGYLTVAQMKGVTGDKITDQFKNALLRYYSTPEYAQEKKLLTQEALAAGATPEEADLQADMQIQKQVKSVGLMKVFSETDAKFMQDWMLKASMDNANTENPNPSIGVSG